MRKAVLLIFCLALIASLAYCASSGSPKAIKSEGVIRVAMGDPDFPPFGYMDSDGNPCGIDVDIAAYIAKSMGVEMRIVRSSFAGIFANIKSGEADIGVATITINASRMSEYTFSDPYYNTGLSIVAPTDFVGDAQSVTLKDYTVAVQVDTVAHQYARDNGVTAVFPVATESEAVSALLDGSAQLALVDQPSGVTYIGSNPDSIKLLPGLLSEYSYGVIMKLGNTALASEVNAALREMKENGEYDKILERHLG